MTKTLLKLAIGGAALAAALDFAPEAQATVHLVTVSATWSPMVCMLEQEPALVNHFIVTTDTWCSASGMWTATYTVSSGQWFGTDPIMGNNTYIHCSATLVGVQVFNDWGTAGDGHDINCLGTAP
jgi:hypothetical protein